MGGIASTSSGGSSGAGGGSSMWSGGGGVIIGSGASSETEVVTGNHNFVEVVGSHNIGRPFLRNSRLHINGAVAKTLEVAEGSEIDLICNAFGKPAPTISWH